MRKLIFVLVYAILFFTYTIAFYSSTKIIILLRFTIF